jgi:hypothetical protein
MGFKWAAIGGILFMYVLITLMFSNNFYWELSAYLLVGYIFGNWAGQEDKEEEKKKNG